MEGRFFKDNLSVLGLVGIGTTSPGSYFGSGNTLVIANTASSAGITIVSNAANSGNIYFSDGTSGSDRTRGLVGYNHAANYMVFHTDAAEAMRIKSNGNVGIGTTNPAGLLHIVGNDGLLFYSQDQYNTTKFYGVNNQTGDGLWEFKNTGTWNQTRFYIEDANNNFSRLTLDVKGNAGAVDILAATSHGNVGIGTTTPGGKLHVYGGTTAFTNLSDNTDSVQITRSTSVHSHQDAKLFIYDNSNSDWAQRISLDGYSYGLRIDSWADYGLYLNHDTLGAILVARSSELVINEDNNNYDFRVEGQTDADLLKCDASADSVGIGGSPNSSYKLDISGDTLIQESESGDLKLVVNNISTSTLARSAISLINNSGSSAGLTLPSTTYTGVTGWANRLILNTDSNISNGILVRPSSGGFTVSANGLANTNLRVDTTGKVGVGTASPSYDLDVIGDISSNGQAIASYRRLRSYDTFTTSTNNTAGWYPLFSWGTTTGDRGGYRVYISYTGGSWAPNTTVLKVFKNWSSDATVTVEKYGGTLYLPEVRVIGDASTATVYTLELYLNALSQGHSFAVYYEALGYDEGGTSNVNWANSSLALSTNIGSVIGSAKVSAEGIATQNLNISGDIYLGDQLIHLDDSNTYFQFPANDTMRLVANSHQRFNIETTETVVNEDGHDYNFRVEGDTDQNLLFVDAGTDRVGIGTAIPAQKLDVIGRIRSSFNSGDYFEMGSSNNGGFLLGFSGGTEVVNVRTYGDSYFNGGNVGIGTTSPNNGLVVSDGIQPSYTPAVGGEYIEIARTSGADAGFLINKNTGQWLFGIDNSDGTNPPLRFEYSAAGSAHAGFGNATLGLALKYDGNVGIGTDAPDGALHLASTASSVQRLIFSNSNANLNPQQRIEFWEGTGTGTAANANCAIEYDGTGTYESSDGTLTIRGSGASVNLPIAGFNRNGNVYLGMSGTARVGIGTTIPSQALNIARSDASGSAEFDLYSTNSAKQPMLTFRKSASNTIGTKSVTPSGGELGEIEFIGVNTGSNFAVKSASIIGLQDGAAGATYIPGALTFGTGTNAAAVSERMRIDASGNVSIGTTTSGSKLHVNGGSKYFGGGDWTTIERVTTTEGNYALYVQTTGTNTNQAIAKFNYGATAGGANTGTAVAAIAREKSYFLSRLGVGTGDPDTKLHIDSGSGIGTVDNAYSLAIRGDGIDGIQILSDSAYSGRIVFGDQNSNNVGRIDYDHSTDAFRFFTNGTEKVSILSDGNVGIGTTNPSNPLDVVGYIKSSIGFKAANYTTMLESGNESVFGNTAYYGVLFKTNNATRMKITNAGLVGIGTTDPRGPLEVHAASDSTLVIERFTSNGIQLRADNSVNSAIRLGFEAYTYEFKNGSGTSRLHIDANGNVGIGTTTPSQKLHVVSGGTNNAARFESTDATARIVLEDNSGQVQVAATGDETVFSKGSGISETMRINTSGNVGINTTSPTSKLQIVGSASGDSVLKVDGTNGTLFEVVDDLSDSLMSVNDAAGLPVFEVFADNHIVAGRYNQNDFYLDTNGNLGLGTSAPSSVLDIYEQSGKDNKLRFHSSTTGSGTSNGSRIGLNGAELFINNTENNAIKIYTQSTQTNGITILGNGDVGIGTVSPGYKLDVVEAGGVASARIRSTNANIARLFLSNTVGTWRLYSAAASNSFRIFSDSLNDDAFVIKSNGNVGIGTPAPEGKLHIFTGDSGGSVNSSADELVIETASTGGIQLLNGTTSSGYILFGDSDANSIGQIRYLHSDNSMRLHTANNERLIIDAGGKVGIGTSSPSQKLHVSGSALVEGALHIGSTNSINLDSSTIYRSNNSFKIIGGGPQSTRNHIELTNGGGLIIDGGSTETAGVEIKGGGGVVKFTQGSVGIGTSSPTRTLHVVGAIQIDGTIDANSGAYLTSGGVWTDASSRELKKDIINLSLIKASEAVKLLNPVEFSYKATPEERRVGFIAEDVPDLVASEGRKGLSSMQIVAALTKVVQNQQKEIEWCKEQIEKLNKKTELN